VKAGRTRGEKEEKKALPTRLTLRGPGRLVNPGEQQAPLQINPLGSSKGCGFPGGSKALKHIVEAREVFMRSAGRHRPLETRVGLPGRRKALKGKPQEREGLK